MIRSLYLYCLNADPESRKLADLIGKYVRPNARILDVGCGYGRNIDFLTQNGFADVTGIDINPEIVEANQKRGLKCIGVDALKGGGLESRFDVVLMSHVIEHFAPADLKDFIDSYLEYLVPDGYLVIATPLMSDYFYDDFDHVKPYQPLGLLQVFGNDKAQIQYYAKNKLALRDVWFRKGYWRFRFFRSNYLRTPATKFLQAITFLSAFLFVISRGVIGRKDGWIGVFQKLHSQ